MNRLVLALVHLTAIQTFSFGQLKGEYCYSFGFGSDCITFLDSNRFEYSSSHCTGHDHGKGKYMLKGKNLILEFQSDTVIPRGELKIQKEKTTSEKVTIDVSIFSLSDKEPLNGVTVLILDTSNIPLAGTLTDSNGHGSIEVPKTLNSRNLKVQYIGYNSVSSTLTLDSNYRISIYLSENTGERYISKETIYLRIKDITETSISLKLDFKKANYQTYLKE
ncbi:MAG: carboxypeptidase-like regulatory domain-containing protein [Bacteroidia bacterium]